MTRQREDLPLTRWWEDLPLLLRCLLYTSPIHLLLENEENDACRLVRQGCAPAHYTAQWNDDLHHVLHVAATHECTGYYADYEGRTDLLAKALAEGFAYQGQMMSYRGSPRGTPSGFLPPGAFVAFIQNHDQIGNRAFGERLGMIAPANVMRALSAVYLLLPQTPMIFMGEEWDAQQPFPFFCDFDGDLAEAVREGRRDCLLYTSERFESFIPQHTGTARVGLRVGRIRMDRLPRHRAKRHFICPTRQGPRSVCGDRLQFYASGAAQLPHRCTSRRIL